MSVPYRITIRISESDMIAMESLIDNSNFESISQIIRVALDQFLEKQKDSGISKKIEVDLSRRLITDLNKIVENGEAISMDDLIRAVLKEYTAKRVESLKEDLKKDDGE